MNIEILSKRCSVRRLDQRDVDSIYALCRENTVFYQYHPPFVTRESILKDMTALPPEKVWRTNTIWVSLQGMNWLLSWI